MQPFNRTVSDDGLSEPGRAITVLIVSHQSEAVLPRCLTALKDAAPNTSFCVKALDNASTDRSAALLREAGIPVIQSKENLGFAAAVNRLALSVDTPFIFLLNPDTAPMAGALDRLVDAARNMPDRAMFCGRTLFADGTENTTSAWAHITPASALFFACGLSAKFPRSGSLSPEAMPDWDRLSDREVDIATGCALLIRTGLWHQLDGFDPRYWLYGEEAEMQIRMVRAGYKPAWFVSAARFIHDNPATLPADAPLDQRVFRSIATLRGRATLMRHTWRQPTRWLASPLLWLTALRHRVQAAVSATDRTRHLRLWQTRADWGAGYPPPDGASGAVTRFGRLIRLVAGVLDPRAYLHALRIVNYYNYAHARPRRQINLGSRVEISPNATFSNGARIQIGDGTVIAAGASLMAGGVHGRIVIGRDCLVGPNVLMTAANYRGDPEGRHRASGMRERDVVIEDNVWIGAGAVLLPGVHIGRGAVIGAGTVITSDVPARAVRVGAPARALE